MSASKTKMVSYLQAKKLSNKSMELESHTLLGSENDNFLSNQIFYHFEVRARLVMKDFFKGSLLTILLFLLYWIIFPKKCEKIRNQSITFCSEFAYSVVLATICYI